MPAAAASRKKSLAPGSSGAQVATNIVLAKRRYSEYSDFVGERVGASGWQPTLSSLKYGPYR